MQIVFWHPQVCATQQIKQLSEIATRRRCDEREATYQ
jgi:hypothetical protein